MAEEKIAGETKDVDYAKRFRSPPYPFVALPKAIERVKELYPKALHHQVGANVLADAWGYSASSSGLIQTAAALIQFGLLIDEGSGPKRKFQLTVDAMRIAQDADPLSEKRKAAVGRAALYPKIHKELWEQYGAATISDVVLKNYLTLDRREAGLAPYSDVAAEQLIAEYKETVTFAGLPAVGIPERGEGKLLSEKPEFSLNESDNSKGGAKVGDFIQAEINGAQQFVEPKRVRAVQSHEGSNWVFVDGEEVGIPDEQIQVVKKADLNAPVSIPRLALAKSMREEKFALKEGDVVIAFPADLSTDSVDDLEDYLKVFLKKARREAKPNS